MAAIRQQISELKEEKEQMKQSMAPTNKIINALRDKISVVKGKESVYDKEKQLK